MPTTTSHTFYLYGAYTFLLIMWVVGYDGIDFMGDVYYLKTGWSFWNGQLINFDNHLSLRWGAYVFSGLFTYILDFSDRSGSLVTLLFYCITVTLIWQVIPYNNLKKWGVLFFISHIFVIHNLSKVYPDSLLILWVLLVPISSLYRHKYPIAAAAVMVFALIFGIGTKETMIFLVPFVFLLFPFDYWRKRELTYYYYFLLFAGLGLIGYLSYFYLYFNDPFYQIRLLQEGDYFSAISYREEGWKSLLARLTYLPILNLVDNYYWLWIIMAIPSWYYGAKYQKAIHIEFALCNSLLLFGFWFMTSSLDYYNPILLNPRYMIIMVAPLSISVASGILFWIQNEIWRRNLALMLVAGGMTALFRSDWLAGFFLEAVAAVVYFVYHKRLWLYFAVLMAIPLLASIQHQHQLKNYRHFKALFAAQILEAETENKLLLTHEFLYRSSNVILGEPQKEYSLISLGSLEKVKQDIPENFTLFTYNYYRHAFLSEQVYLDEFSDWARLTGYSKTTEYIDEWIRIENYSRVSLED